MHVLAIDAGAYSVKYVSSILDKRHAVHRELREFVIAEALEENPDWGTPEEATRRLMERIVEDVARPDTRIVLHVPTESVTTRFLTLPVKNRRKAEAMIPFQLEEDIPFALHESHYAWYLEPTKSQSLALVALTRDAEFSAFHQPLTTWTTPPSVVTSEPSTMDSFYGFNHVAGPFCVLDMGHRSTKAYFFYNSKLIATHVSYVGGRHLDEMISQTYGVSAAEAVLYKHQNAFVLTGAQMDEVEENQREFARMMDQALKPLVSDFLRWELGFRVAHGMKISQVFLCGGTAAVKNMPHYLTEKFAVKSVLLESFEGIDTSKVDLNVKARAKFTLANMLALSLRSKNRLVNLLTGRYAPANRGDLPLPQFVFISTRAALVAAVLLVALIAEGVLLEMDLRAVNLQMTTLARNQALKLNPRDRRNLTFAPAQVSAGLVRQQRTIRQQISTLQSASDIRALHPLVLVAGATAGSPATLVSFEATDGGDVTAQFTATEPAALKDLAPKLESLALDQASTTFDETGLKLKLTGVQR